MDRLQTRDSILCLVNVTTWAEITSSPFWLHLFFVSLMTEHVSPHWAVKKVGHDRRMGWNWKMMIIFGFSYNHNHNHLMNLNRRFTAIEFNMYVIKSSNSLAGLVIISKLTNFVHRPIHSSSVMSKSNSGAGVQVGLL